VASNNDPAHQGLHTLKTGPDLHKLRVCVCILWVLSVVNSVSAAVSVLLTVLIWLIDHATMTSRWTQTICLCLSFVR